MWDVCYCLDANALIQLHENFPETFPMLAKACRTGRIRVPEGVYREIRRVTDRLKRIVEEWEDKHHVVIRLRNHNQAKALLPEIERKYGERIVTGRVTRRGLWRSKSGQRSADAQVIAFAKADGMIVVSNDEGVQSASLLEDVQVITWQEFARRLRAEQNRTQD